MLKIHLEWRSFQPFRRETTEFTAPKCPTHYSPSGNGDGLDIVVHKNVRLSEVIVSDILNSDHLPIVFIRCIIL
jgi:hypothetical protein